MLRCFHIAPAILAVTSMPNPIYSQEATGSGGPASSAQADIALAGSEHPESATSIYGLGGLFHLRSVPDVEYTAGRTSTVVSRGASIVPRPMPVLM